MILLGPDKRTQFDAASDAIALSRSFAVCTSSFETDNKNFADNFSTTITGNTLFDLKSKESSDATIDVWTDKVLKH